MDTKSKPRSPAFQLYPGDFLADAKTAVMSAEEIGAYFLLLCYCWREGTLPNDMKKLATLARLPKDRFEEIWQDSLSVCFEMRDERLIHPRLEDERAKQDQWKSKSSEGGKKSAEKRWGNRDKQDKQNIRVVTDCLPPIDAHLQTNQSNQVNLSLSEPEPPPLIPSPGPNLPENTPKTSKNGKGGVRVVTNCLPPNDNQRVTLQSSSSCITPNGVIERAAAGAAAKPRKSAPKERDPLLDNPAVALTRELTHLWPPALVRAKIAETVTDIDLWRKCVEFVALRTGRTNNYDYMLDCYREPWKLNPATRALRSVETGPKPPVGTLATPTPQLAPVVPGLPQRVFGPDGFDQFGYDVAGRRNPFDPPVTEKLFTLQVLLERRQTPDEYFQTPNGSRYDERRRAELSAQWDLVQRAFGILLQFPKYQERAERDGWPVEVSDNETLRLFWDRINGISPTSFFWWSELLPHFGASDRLPDPNLAVS